jgi:pimeloyl-ACP methyl ester carboxylesterase
VNVPVGGQVRGGILTSAPDPRAAMVVVHGSGAGSRSNHADLATSLARAGIAVLVVDKPMTGYSWRNRDYAALADDAAAQASWLARYLDLPPSRVGLVGVSEGGWVALLAVQAGPLVLDSAPVVTPLEQAAYAASRLTPTWAQHLTTGMLASGRTVCDYLDTDVRPALSRVHVPVLAIFGTDDRTVPVTQAVDRLQQGLPAPATTLLTAGGHTPPVSTWAGQTAAWILNPSSSHPGVYGTPPAATVGAPTPPRPSWLLNPFSHLLLGALAASGVYLLSRRKDRS